jgi:hypothetical protein
MGSKVAVSRLGILAAIALVFSVMLPAQALTRDKRTYAIKACAQTRFKPRSFTIRQSCWADAGIYARKTTWRYWDRKKFGDRWAKADTKIFRDDCRPDCADGHFHHRAAHVWLTGRGWCKSVHRFVYRVQHIKYVGPDIGVGPPIRHWPHGWHILGCPPKFP